MPPLGADARYREVERTPRYSGVSVSRGCSRAEGGSRKPASFWLRFCGGRSGCVLGGEGLGAYEGVRRLRGSRSHFIILF